MARARLSGVCRDQRDARSRCRMAPLWRCRTSCTSRPRAALRGRSRSSSRSRWPTRRRSAVLVEAGERAMSRSSPAIIAATTRSCARRRDHRRRRHRASPPTRFGSATSRRTISTSPGVARGWRRPGADQCDPRYRLPGACCAAMSRASVRQIQRHAGSRSRIRRPRCCISRAARRHIAGLDTVSIVDWEMVARTRPAERHGESWRLPAQGFATAQSAAPLARARPESWSAADAIARRCPADAYHEQMRTPRHSRHRVNRCRRPRRHCHAATTLAITRRADRRAGPCRRHDGALAMSLLVTGAERPCRR